MPARKRASTAANGINGAEPVAKRRSTRHAAAAPAPQGTSEMQAALKSTTPKSVKSGSTKAPGKATGKASQGKGRGKGTVALEKEQASNSKTVKATPPSKDVTSAAASAAAKPAGKKGSKGKKTGVSSDVEGQGDESPGAGSEDVDVDSIPAVNPDAPRHEGEWYWLMKAEPETRLENGHDVRFSIDDLRARTKPEGWDGIRAYPARNNMRNMNVGDKAFFYHSNCKEPGIVGIMEIVKEFSEDKSARQPGTPYYDPSSTKDKPKWDLVHVEFRKKFAVPIYLKELRKMGEAGGPLQEMQMLKLGRLSVSKVSGAEWKVLCELADEKAKEAGLKHEE